MRRIAALLAIAAPISGAAADTGALVQFVACPVYRDTDAGRKSGCWLADDAASGVRYDVSLSPYKPDWNHAVLVEGRVSAAPPTPCGGAVLDAVRTSVLAEDCTRHVLPAEGFPGRRFVLPVRNNSPMGVARVVPPPPYAARTFSLFFEFDRSFLTYQYGDYLLDQAITWIAAARPRRLVVTGFAATDPIAVSGRTLAERSEVASERAEVIAESLRRLLPATPVEVRTELASQPFEHPDADGLPGQSQRRVEIRAEF